MREFQKLVEWTSRFITERLSTWVLEHGGWVSLIIWTLHHLAAALVCNSLIFFKQAAVLQESVDQAYRVAVVSLCLLTAVALSVWLTKRH